MKSLCETCKSKGWIRVEIAGDVMRGANAPNAKDPRGKRDENKRDHFDFASFGRPAPEMVSSGNSFRVPPHQPEMPQIPTINTALQP
jgi:hypothetical protein